MTLPNAIIADLAAEVESLKKQRDEWRDKSLINEKLRIDISLQRDEWRERAEFSYAERSKLERQRDELLNYLHDAATSLETIAVRSYGEESYLDSKPQMRGYAASRAAAAREDIASGEMRRLEQIAECLRSRIFFDFQPRR